MSKNVSSTDQSPEVEVFFHPTKAKLKGCTRLNVRELPSGDSKTIGFLTSSDRIKVDNTYRNNSWVKIIEPKFGYVKKEFVEVM